MTATTATTVDADGGRSWGRVAAVGIGLGFWMLQVAFHTLGVLDTGEWGYPGWSAGFASFPRWFQSMVASTAFVAVLPSLLVAGAALAVEGWRAVRTIAALVAGATVLAVTLIVVGTWVWPDA